MTHTYIDRETLRELADEGNETALDRLADLADAADDTGELSELLDEGSQRAGLLLTRRATARGDVRELQRIRDAGYDEAGDELARWLDQRPDTTTPPAVRHGGGMLDHIAVQVRDIAASAAFYDAVLAPLGGERQKRFGENISFGTTGTTGHPLWLVPATDEAPARELHLAFTATDRAAVDAFHAAALAAGAESLHAPGLHPEYHASYYGAFVRDPDGNNVEAVCHRVADPA
ncbi:VOC family protein [Streptomyces sp. NPDC048172]|uniref:VOC family protein n=1 Tax=Streptomyces sp. NPDC048172 TaxID=3365505 RepID=UPI003723B127